MKPAILTLLTIFAALSQPAGAPPKFEAADVQVSVPSLNPVLRITPPHGGRYQLKRASMVDLIRIAYTYLPTKILGGPSWLEMNRFDVIAKVPPDTTPETVKPMLQSLLADRFHLVLHKENRPFPGYALVVDKKPQLKPADASGKSACQQQPPPAEPSQPTQFICRNMTMAAFADWLSGWLGRKTALDRTGLQGAWDFDFGWTLAIGPTPDGGARITVLDAIEKLGLKLEEAQVPAPVLVVDSVSEAPGPNPPGTAEALPPVPVPTRFEVASIKPSDPNNYNAKYDVLPGGRVTIVGIPLRSLVSGAFGVNIREQLVGLPDWADSERFDVFAKAPSEGPSTPAIDREAANAMMRTLLVERFKIAYHTEDRQLPVYALVAGKPKLKKADPAERTSCIPNPPSLAAPEVRVLTCRNATLEQFADQLRLAAREQFIAGVVVDATGIEGRWDLSLTFTPDLGFRRVADAGQEAPDPAGGLNVFEAMEKQLGLKIEKQKRTMPVTVIDHIEQKPTEN